MVSDLFLAEDASYTKTEQQIIEFICQNPSSFLTVSISQLARRLEVSDATVSRFARHAGYRDFKDLKTAVAQAMEGAGPAEKLKESILEKRALVLKDNTVLIGALAFTRSPGSIEFLGIHPQYRNLGIQKLFLNALLQIYLPGQDISTTTYRKGDKADTGYRNMLLKLGFSERELLTEYGYPTQRFVYQDQYREEKDHA